MSRAYFETSALIDWAFGDADRKMKVQGLVPDGAALCTSQRAVFEVSAGFLSYLILLYNKSLLCRGFSELNRYANSHFRHPHRMGTMTGALDYFFTTGAAFPSSTDEECLLRAQGCLRRMIRSGFRKITGNKFQIVNKVGCRSDLGTLSEDAQNKLSFKLPTGECGKLNNCQLKQYYLAHIGEFRRIRHKLTPALDKETERRIDAIGQLCEKPKQDFTYNVCRAATDATLTHEAPSESVVITKNRKHIEPIVEALRKNGAYYC